MASSSASAAAAHPSRALTIVGRCGYAGRGLIYLTVGLLALLAAAGSSEGATTDAQGAARTIDQLPMGDVLLVAAIIGLIGYAIWRFVQAFSQASAARAERSKGRRFVLALDGLFHAGLALIIFSVVMGQQQGSGEQRSEDWTAEVLAQPFGRWLVIIGGLLAIGGGLYRIYRGWTKDYAKNLRPDASGWPVRVLKKAGRYGDTARGVVFTVIGIFLLRAGWQHDPEQTVGVAGALHALRSQPAGWLWLGLIALGFIAFGLYSLLETKYRRIV